MAKRGNFTNWQKGILRVDGFIPEEIEAFDKATNPDGTPHFIDFYSETFKGMRADRRQWKKDRIEIDGWTREQCENDTYEFFKASQDKSIWWWLQAAYKPPRKLADFTEASRKRATARRQKAKERIRRGMARVR